MALLKRFSPPANLSELPDASRETWSEVVHVDVAGFAEVHPHFFDPMGTETITDAALAEVAWLAFPATLLHGAPSDAARWAAADASRDRQDEYCEWSVARDAAGNLTAVTFTTETPEYYGHLAIVEPDLLAELYAGFMGRTVKPEELQDADGNYDPRNPLNTSTEGRIAHLSQGTNTLGAAIRLAAEATDLYVEADGSPVINQQRLVVCGGLGEPLRNSDPQIASAVNNLSTGGAEITLADPLGLYIHDFLFGDVGAPGGLEPQELWHVERGDDGFAVRARFELPPESGFRTSDVKVGGVPLTFGAQLADRVRVKIRVIAQPSEVERSIKTCRRAA
jgi:hypothetical protein